MLDQKSLDHLIVTARTHNGWRNQPVSDEQIRKLYDLVKMLPTSANSQPARYLFLKSQAAKERLKPALSSSNVEKTMTAPVVAIVAYDTMFHENLPRTFPHNPGFKAGYDGDDKAAARQTFAFRNGTLSGAYLIVCARALGLDTGPMSGFDNGKVDAEFFPDGRCKSNFLVNIGHGDPAKVLQRLPRLDFEEVAKII
jgi:3-hydroxypropanoate dehydrogenase